MTVILGFGPERLSNFYLRFVSRDEAQVDFQGSGHDGHLGFPI